VAGNHQRVGIAERLLRSAAAATVSIAAISGRTRRVESLRLRQILRGLDRVKRSGCSTAAQALGVGSRRNSKGAETVSARGYVSLRGHSAFARGLRSVRSLAHPTTAGADAGQAVPDRNRMPPPPWHRGAALQLLIALEQCWSAPRRIHLRAQHPVKLAQLGKLRTAMDARVGGAEASTSGAGR